MIDELIQLLRTSSLNQIRGALETLEKDLPLGIQVLKKALKREKEKVQTKAD